MRERRRQPVSAGLATLLRECLSPSKAFFGALGSGVGGLDLLRKERGEHLHGSIRWSGFHHFSNLVREAYGYAIAA